MAEPTYLEQALALVKRAGEVDDSGNSDRAATYAAQAQVFATLHSAQVSGLIADQLLKIVNDRLTEMNANVEDIVRRMPAS
ncbi:hypothetical protein CH275_16800 [Rhodococcus sp. 06-235-1A]|uniref:hypothetical protein n=1 Tax=Rhodococcus sp. 06-235-1A TaxID=2022508 RepID=UPI000B9C5E96|nr:hypothetical protein [Rhodococcus sp. 06-235-1A]OZD03425.1 hypothetical protein CH275_16800 [Rhodococcus sp. 06-235-1A]